MSQAALKADPSTTSVATTDLQRGEGRRCPGHLDLRVSLGWSTEVLEDVMLHRIVGLIMVCALAFALGVPSVADAASGKNNKAGKVEGTLVGVAANGVVIQTRSGTMVSVGVTSATKVELNDVRVPVTQLPLGSRAQALFDPATKIATKVEATTP